MARKSLKVSSKPSRDRRRAGPGEADLVEGKMHVVIPRHDPLDEPQFAFLIVVPTVREWPADELAQTVVQSIDRLDGGGRVLPRRLRQRSLRDVDKQSQTVAHILVQGALQSQDHAPARSVTVEAVDIPAHLEQSAAGGHVFTGAGISSRTQSASWAILTSSS